MLNAQNGRKKCKIAFIVKNAKQGYKNMSKVIEKVN